MTVQLKRLLLRMERQTVVCRTRLDRLVVHDVVNEGIHWHE